MTTYPPELPPATRTDTTPARGNHAEDHNELAAALAAIVEQLGPDPAGGNTSVTARLLALDPDGAGGAGIINVKAYGAKGDGTTDDTAAINNALAASAAAVIGSLPGVPVAATPFGIGPTVYLPPGTYLVTDSIVKPVGVSLEMSPSAILRASGAGMAAKPLLTCNNVAGTMDQHVSITGGILDCALAAQDGISFPYFAHLKISNIQVLNPVRHFVVLGDTAAPAVSYEGIVRGLDTRRSRGTNPAAGSVGLWFRNCSDGEVSVAHINGADIGTQADQGGTTFTQVHVWNFGGSTNPSVCFKDNATFYANTYLGCVADSSSLYGFHLAGGWGNIIGGAVYANTNVADNTLTGVQVGGTQGLVYVSGLQIVGSDSSHRIAKDVGGNLLFSEINTRNVNVVTETNANRVQMRSLRLYNPGGGAELTLAKQTGNGANFQQALRASDAAIVHKVTQYGETVGAGIAAAVKSISSAYTITPSDSTLLATGTFTVTLPTVASVDPGRIFIVKNVGSGTITVAPQGASTLDAGGTLVGAGAKGWYQSNGSNWIQIA